MLLLAGADSAAEQQGVIAIGIESAEQGRVMGGAAKVHSRDDPQHPYTRISLGHWALYIAL